MQNGAGRAKCRTPLMKKLEIKKIDVDTNFEIASKYTIHAVPTLLIERDGVVFKRYTGVTRANVLEADLNAALK